MASLRDLDIPAEVQDRLNEFDDAFTELERDVAVLLEVPVNELHAKVMRFTEMLLDEVKRIITCTDGLHKYLTSLEKARMDLISAYVANSLFWMYLKTVGHNPSEHPIKQELDRIRKYMARVKELEDKKLAPKINKDVTKKFVRSALWQAAHSEAASKAATAASDAPANATMPGAVGHGTPGAVSGKSYASAAAAQSSGVDVTPHAGGKRGGSSVESGSKGLKAKKCDGGGRHSGSPKRNKNKR